MLSSASNSLLDWGLGDWLSLCMCVYWSCNTFRKTYSNTAVCFQWTHVEMFLLVLIISAGNFEIFQMVKVKFVESTNRSNIIWLSFALKLLHNIISYLLLVFINVHDSVCSELLFNLDLTRKTTSGDNWVLCRDIRVKEVENKKIISKDFEISE